MKNDYPINPSITSGHLLPYWVEDSKVMLFGKLKGDIDVDVAVVGGGISGISTAYFLCLKGTKVAVIEDGAIGSGESGRTTAHITSMLDVGYSELIDMYGIDNAKLVALSQIDAIEKISSIIDVENIKCDFKRIDGYLFAHPLDEKNTLEKELQALKQVGIDCHIVDNAPLPFETGKSIVYPSQARFHIMKYLMGLAKRIIKEDGIILTNTHVDKIREGAVVTKDGRVNANEIVVATDAPVKGAQIFNKMAPYRTYVVAAKIKKNSVLDALYWDTGYKKERLANPYHYVRIQELDDKKDLIMIGGEDHKVGQGEEENAFLELKKWALGKFPMIKEFSYAWSGQIEESIDGLAYIGKSPWHDFNLYFATGFCGVGMTNSNISGQLISDLIMGKENKYAQIYSPKRKTISTLSHAISENANVVLKFIADRVWKEKTSILDLANDDGAIIDVEKEKLAVYRDFDGNLHSYTAICPHKKCVLKWNNMEKSFDCPCHGSRFDSFGRVLHGPAIKNLDEKPLAKGLTEATFAEKMTVKGKNRARA